MKKTTLRKQSHNKLSTLKRKLWKVFSQFIKLRDNFTCFTCGLKVQGHNCQAGHFIPKAAGGLALYFNEDNVHVQCGRCNLTEQGNQHIYGEKLGKEVVDKLRKLQGTMVKWSETDYLNEIKYYGQRIKNIKRTEGGAIHDKSPFFSSRSGNTGW